MKIIRFLTALIVVLFMGLPVFAEGDPNMDGGGGGVGDGDTEGGSYWNVGEDGVRVTVVKEKMRTSVTTPLDFTNANLPSDIYFFGHKNKMQHGGALTLQVGSSYPKVKPSAPLPQVVSSGGGSNITAVKEYFKVEGTIRDIAQKTGFDYDELINGDYVLLLEPILYFRYNGLKFAATATEVALYDQMTSGDIRAKLGNATHQNLPLAMYLEVAQLGFPAYSGSTSGIKDDATIISQLGLGIINFKEPVPDPEVSTYDYEYRTDTDVITAVRVYNHGGDITPDHNARLTFSVLGNTYTKSFVIPSGESQLIWFKWHTPTEPQVVNIGVSSSRGSPEKSTITCNVVKLEEFTPPNPTGRDRNDGFKTVSAPSYTTKSTATWGEWDAYWVPDWEWESDDDGEGGHWVDNGWWEYEWLSYTAKLVGTTELTPDEKVPTAKDRYSSFEIKSGYGFNIRVTASVTSSRNYDVTPIQNAVTLFPEFEYKTYDRLLEATQAGYYSVWEFAQNKYSMTKQRVHFTPLWYPDGNYKAYMICFDAWTPDGQLSYQDTFDFEIDGDVYKDWFISPMA